MTPADICHQMNVVYEALKLASPDQLRALYRAAVWHVERAHAIKDMVAVEHCERFAYQIYETARRRNAGIW